MTNTLQTVLSITRRNLLKIRGLSEVKVEKIKEAAGKLMVSTTCINSQREACTDSFHSR